MSSKSDWSTELSSRMSRVEELCVSLSMHAREVCTMECMWGSENGLRELVVSYHYVGRGDQTQVVRLGGKCPY